MYTEGGILQHLTRSPLCVPDREWAMIVDSSKVSGKDVGDFLEEVFRLDTKPHAIYLPAINACIRKDKPGMCAVGFSGEYREQTVEERNYIENFLKQFKKG